jgi:hypothetical protein
LSDHNVFKLTQPDSFTDSLTDILREGARALLAQAIEAEVADFLAQHASLRRGDQGGSSYCLTEEYSRHGRSLPHHHAPGEP